MSLSKVKSAAIRARKAAISINDKYTGKVVVIGAGHGGMVDKKYQTPGKRAYFLNGQLMDVKKLGVNYCEGNCTEKYYEGQGNRLIRQSLCRMLLTEGIEYICINEGQDDMLIGDRTNYVNEICDIYGTKNVLGLSIHSDGYHIESAHGAGAYTSIGQTASDPVAECWYKHAREMYPNEKLRTDKGDGDLDQEKNLAMTRDTKCRFVLIENFFMTNYADFTTHLQTESGRNKLARVMFNVIKEMI